MVSARSKPHVMFSIQKIAVFIIIIAVVWLGFRFVGNLEKQRKAQERLTRPSWRDRFRRSARKTGAQRAKEAGHEVKVGRFPFVGNGKAIALGEDQGMIKTVFDAKTGELLGAHMIGAEVTELIQGYTVAKSMETTEAELMHTVFPHPTLSEMMHESVLDAYGRAIHF